MIKRIIVDIEKYCDVEEYDYTKKLYPRSPKVEFSFINLYNTIFIVSYVCLIYN